jgi:hypothetical protein
MALFVREFECPSCGGTIQRENPASRSISCPYCGQTSHINADSLDAVGAQHLLIDYGSMFSVGMTATVKGHRFRVLGKLRIEYGDGFWDEWYIELLDANKYGWIQEDDGGFVLFVGGDEVSALNYDGIKVGTSVALSDKYPNVFITSKSRAKVEGGEGELPFAIIPGDTADFIEGISEGKVVSVEILGDENNLFVGAPFKIDEVQV